MDELDIRRQAVAYAARLLTEEEAEVLDRRAVDDPRVGEILAAASGSSPIFGSPRHLPAAVLARWDRMRSELRGLERAVVRAHLEGCDVCRDSLVRLGHEPVLPRMAGLDLEAPPAWLEATPSSPGASAYRPPVLRMPRAAWKRPEVYIGWGLAAAASVALVFTLQSRPRPSKVPPPLGGLGAGTASNIGSHSALANPVITFDLDAGTNGATPTLTLDPQTRIVVFRVPSTARSRSGQLTLEITDEQGEPVTVQRISMENGPLEFPTSTTIFRASGVYRARLRRDSEDIVSETRFRVLREATLEAH